MGALSRAIENFIFRSFDIFGRAKRSEYWIAMPLVWGLIAVLIWIDARMVWSMLLASEVPPLSPLAYGSLMAIVLTLPGRFSLTVRRLNDAGRSPKFVLLPMKATLLALIGLFGFVTSLMSTTGGAGLTLALVLTLRFGAEADLWPVLFAAAQSVEAGLLTDLAAMVDVPSLSEMGANLAANLPMMDPAMGAAALYIIALFVLGPPLLMLLFFLFVSMPSKRTIDDDGPGAFKGTTRRRDPDRPSRAMASYALLDRIHAPPEEVDHVARREEVRALYRQRVLGEPVEPDGA